LAELIKNCYDLKFIEKVCNEISRNYKEFDSSGFTNAIFDKNWEKKELKERMRHITICFREFLPDDYLCALEILMKTSVHFNFDFAPMVFPDFVEVYGLKYDESIDALEHFTRHSSSEFAVRPYILNDSKKMINKMIEWSKSDNHHVRRFASEGSRPRLPWAVAIPSLKEDPTPILPILEALKNDPELYVRRSVANSLNDIAKDNPDVVIEIAKRWIGKNKELDWVVKHGCRTLLKSGNHEILNIFGYLTPHHIRVENIVVQKEVLMEEDLHFSFDLNTESKKLGKLRIEYAINYMKSNGKRSRKVFKVSEADFSVSSRSIKKKQSFKTISTRKHYKGEHSIVIIINGVDLSLDTFMLK
jgi:3-methyladenine DNA glycosylase AlkC